VGPARGPEFGSKTGNFDQVIERSMSCCVNRKSVEGKYLIQSEEQTPIRSRSGGDLPRSE
jgi:hypothetical protein